MLLPMSQPFITVVVFFVTDIFHRTFVVVIFVYATMRVASVNGNRLHNVLIQCLKSTLTYLENATFKYLIVLYVSVILTYLY